MPYFVRALGVVVEYDDCMLEIGTGRLVYAVERLGTPYDDYPSLISDESGQSAYGCRFDGPRLICDTQEL